MNTIGKIFSVSEFLQNVNAMLQTDFDLVTIQGEVSGYRVSQGKWAWFALKDAGACMDCFMPIWYVKIPLQDGMMIKATGFPTVFERSGRFTFKPQHIEAIGEGTLKKQYELLYKKLETEGLFREDRKRVLPKFPSRIGLITSRDAAAYSDFLKVLRHRWGGIHIDLYHVQVQGEAAIKEICEALEFFNVRRGGQLTTPTVLVLTRGGGSLEDLMPFNSEEVARAIFSSKIPVLAAIGHERDVTIAELVSDVRASTPSNAAELLVPERRDILRTLENQEKSFENILASRMEQYLWSMETLLHRMNRAFGSKIERYKHFEKELFAHLLAVKQKISYSKESVEGLEKLLRSLAPQEVLKRGFTFTRDKNGNILRSIKNLSTNDEIETQFADGKIQSKVL